MTSNTLNYHQLFQLQRTTLEKRISNYYDETRDSKTTISYLIALQIRDELSSADFSYMLGGLVRHIFLETKSTRALRRYYYLFKEYFASDEWKLLTSRLFAFTMFVAEKIEKLGSQLAKLRPKAFSVP
ncbi:hypothetical protein [Enterococcus pallens]|uniref:Uncharacterized protein n=1 Tax=Enterococcus pallens ATCC BAA-351 TaxID=1158607 RepID=R2PW02_9ENTE|nr:hypothetical protein [Enterococcus pallens]EOH88687.1 hypothetical protein UAU_04507 [Enterococcus pallens ATCC BAA-351]EOU17868.1 hypothetical protein I588_02856 [Enterococcus pallens ATCC BAA-351]OJG82509.1 hypothetical protein RV10_GL000330 [Enterococcus pallens]